MRRHIAAGLFVLFAACSRTEKPVTTLTDAVAPPSAPARYYAWTDESGRAFVTVAGGSAVSTPTPFDAGVQLAEVPSPAVMNGTSNELHTFQLTRLSEQVIAQMPLSPDGKPVVHVIGEMHMGGSQIQVARHLCKLLTEHEIDAVLIEQAETATFHAPENSAVYDADGQIAALQYAMIRLSEGLDYASAYVKRHGDSDEMPSAAVLRKLEAGLIAADAYKKHALVTAADYVFVASHLRGRPLPFHGIESVELRGQFSRLQTESGPEFERLMRDRDTHMAERAQALIREKGYRRVALVCGAGHIPSLPNELSNRGLAVSTDYTESVPGPFKETIASAEHPEVIRDIMNRRIKVLAPPPSFTPRADMAIPAGPSVELSEFMREVTGRVAGENSDVAYHALEKDYEAKSSSRTSWEATATVNDKTIVLRRELNADIVKAIERRAEPTTLPTQWEEQSRDHLLFDYESSVRNAKLAERNPRVSVITVEDKGDRYVLYGGKADPTIYEGNDFRALMTAVKEKNSGTLIYFDFKGSTAEKREAFASNCRRNAPEGMSIREFDRREEGDMRLVEVLVEPRAEISNARIREIETVSEGPRKGWFRLVVDFLVRTGTAVKRVTVTFYAQTSGSLQGLRERLIGARANSALTAEMSVAEIINFARIDLDKRQIMVEASFARETEKSIIAQLKISPGQRTS